jgi:hypothetical protein
LSEKQGVESSILTLTTGFFSYCYKSGTETGT